jgi:hypothetical protein
MPCHPMRRFAFEAARSRAQSVGRSPELVRDARFEGGAQAALGASPALHGGRIAWRGPDFDQQLTSPREMASGFPVAVDGVPAEL